jgi:hypothetical protein
MSVSSLALQSSHVDANQKFTASGWLSGGTDAAATGAGLAAGIAVGIVLAVLGLCAGIGFFLYRHLKRSQRLRSSGSGEITHNLEFVSDSLYEADPTVTFTDTMTYEGSQDRPPSIINMPLVLPPDNLIASVW